MQFIHLLLNFFIFLALPISFNTLSMTDTEDWTYDCDGSVIMKDVSHLPPYDVSTNTHFTPITSSRKVQPTFETLPYFSCQVTRRLHDEIMAMTKLRNQRLKQNSFTQTLWLDAWAKTILGDVTIINRQALLSNNNETNSQHTKTCKKIFSDLQANGYTNELSKIINGS